MSAQAGHPGGGLRALVSAEGILVYGNRPAPSGASGGGDSEAFVECIDRFGEPKWTAVLGAGHVAKVVATPSGYLATGFRTTDFNSGPGDAFVARIAMGGAVGFQTPLGYGYARGLGIGADPAGNITLIGMEASLLDSGWDVLVARLSPNGVVAGKKSFVVYDLASTVDHADVDLAGVGYVDSFGGGIEGVTKVSSSGEVLWASHVHGAFGVRSDGAIQIANRELLMTFAGDGTRLADVPWYKNERGIGRAVAFDPSSQRVAVGGYHEFLDGFDRLETSYAIVVVLEPAGTRAERLLAGNKSGIRIVDSVAFDGDALVVAGSFTGDIAFDEASAPLLPEAGSHFLARIPIPTSL